MFLIDSDFFMNIIAGNIEHLLRQKEATQNLHAIRWQSSSGYSAWYISKQPIEDSEFKKIKNLGEENNWQMHPLKLKPDHSPQLVTDDRPFFRDPDDFCSGH